MEDATEIPSENDPARAARCLEALRAEDPENSEPFRPLLDLSRRGSRTRRQSDEAEDDAPPRATAISSVGGRGQANKVLSEYRQAHYKRFALPAQDTQLAWRQAPTDHTKLLDLCTLHYVRKVSKNHTVRLNGRVIDIPRRTDSKHATYAGKDVVVKHLLSGDYRVFYGEECIAWANGLQPKPTEAFNRQQPE